MSKLKDLAGQKFGKLTVTSNHYRKNNKTYWTCICDCGNQVDVYSYNLIAGRTKSCGCLRKEPSPQKGKKLKPLPQLRKDITNQRFGLLTALYPTEKRKGRNIIWHCQCDCGNYKDASTGDLVTGTVQSCGCLHSKGETKIRQLLQKNNISFKEEKTFDTCIFSDTKAKARFDFFVGEKYLIEYDGEQHFSYRTNPKTWNDKENLEKTQKRNAYKNQWCKENNIPLIRIPYTHYNDLCIEDLLLETSKFIINN